METLDAWFPDALTDELVVFPDATAGGELE